MISKRYSTMFCKDDISKIENYEQAINDTTQIWDCHHRLELTLDGDFAHTHDDLIRMDMYYNRPYFELIFLTRAEHNRLHKYGRTLSDETIRKMSESQKGKTISDDTRKKISEAMKGRTAPNKGKTMSDEQKRKLSEARKAYLARRKAQEK